MLTRQKKEEIVSDLAAAFRAQGTVLMVDYQGVSAPGMVDLRQRVRDAGGKIKVVKKTLLRRAFEAAGLPVPGDDVFTGQTGVIYGLDDPVGAAKTIAAFRKGLAEKASNEAAVVFTLRGGILDGRVLGESDAKALSMIPSYEELLAKAASAIASPLRGLVGVLSGPSRELVYALNAIAQSKS